MKRHVKRPPGRQTDIPLRQTVTTVVLRPVLLSTLTHPLTTLHRGVESLFDSRKLQGEGADQFREKAATQAWSSVASTQNAASELLCRCLQDSYSS